MKSFKEGDVVSFDIFCATGSGWVIEGNSGSCTISVASFSWKDGFEEQQDDLYEKYGINDYCITVKNEELKEIKEEDWTDDFRENYVEETIFDKKKLEKLSEEEKQRVRKHISILCEHDNYVGLHGKGYLCYGGSPLYECDWEESRRCLERCMEKQPDTDIANTLGYIYYYGRCSDNNPDYEKAYKYFSMAALDGNHEALYKTGDMYAKGLGVIKNTDLADSLYSRVYNETRRQILARNRISSFADAALRIAGSFERNEYVESMIYGMYLEADLGLKIREPLSYYGDSVVRKSVDAGLEKYRPKDNASVYHSYDSDFANCFSEDNLNGNAIKAIVSRKGNRVDCTLEVIDSETKKKSKDAYALLTIPELSYCNFVRSYSFSCTVMEDGFCDIEDGKNETVFCKDVQTLPIEIMFVTDEGCSISVESEDWTLRRPTKRDEFSPTWNDFLDD